MARVDLQHKRSLDDEKKQCRKIAKDLRYPQEVLDKITNAKTTFELSRIMVTARGEAT